MGDIPWTPDQRDAIHRTGCSVVVSAAAGSGKTAVLAERCAYLVCDAPPPYRCGVDRLLVVTFTEAAAAEMKERIRKNFQDRLRKHPRDARLREQAALVEFARISTIHAFCNWLIRRWFSKVGIDPAAPVLPDDEARILKSDAMDRLVEDLYARDDASAERFRALVDVYGLGDDGAIRAFVLNLANYLDSLPDPDGWLDDACVRVGGCDGANDGPRCVRRLVVEPLLRELSLQRVSAEHHARPADPDNRFDAFYAELFRDHAACLARWEQTLEHARTCDGADDCALVAAFENVRGEIAGYRLSTRGAPRVTKKDDPSASDRRDVLKKTFETARDRLESRLVDRFARFTVAETLQNLATIHPFVTAFAELTRSFRAEYRQAKQRLGVVDFADLEARAFALLRDDEVAAVLRERFMHVLVDEYQDISPLQDALLRRVSREDCPEVAANLFTVGDVKQSIYGFRSAEPDVFRRRIESCDGGEGRGAVVRLGENFRSRPPILDSVNLLFERLMHCAVGGIDYDETHALHAGRTDGADAACAAVELHLLAWKGPPVETADDDDDDHGNAAQYVDLGDPAEWQAIEREAYVIATEIRRLRSSGMTVGDRPLRLGDVAVLLRSAKHTTDRLASFLERMGLQACAHSGNPPQETTELSDVRALLNVIDNARQDIPLATVLRSHLLAERLTEDDLLVVRRFNRDVPFHEVVRLYADSGDDGALRERIRRILRRVADLRGVARQQPVADLIQRILHDFGYLAYAGGLADGDRRRRNLLWLHERARRFGTFTNQGLRRFIRYLDDLNVAGTGLGGAPRAALTEDAVQIMSFHGSKGLEFPVVFVADLGRRFNLTDKRGRFIFDRGARIGLKVVDTERMIEYPSAAHSLVAAAIDRRTRAEELRMLYVAMTRARERLILVGRADLDAIESRRRFMAPASVTHLDIESAMSFSDWIVPTLSALPAGAVCWSGRGEANAVFRVHTHGADAMAGWRIDPAQPDEDKRMYETVADLGALPPDEPLPDDPEPAERTLNRLTFVYPHLSLCGVRAIVAAGEVETLYDPLRDPEERGTGVGAAAVGVHRPAAESAPEASPPSVGRGVGRREALRRGTAVHAVMQHIDLAAAGDADGVRLELRRLVAAGRLTESDAERIDVDEIAWFTRTPQGRAAREAGDRYHREFMFIAAHAAHWFDDGVAADAGERVLVRGVVDGVIDAGDHTEVIDFKTDIVTGPALDERARRYANQLALYAASIEPIFRKPTTRAGLVFLHARRIVPVSPDRFAGTPT